MKTYHILNGDCLAAKFPSELDGEIIIWRECLIDGPLQSEDFFESREIFINQNFPDSDANYYEKVIQEFQKILEIPDESLVYFWFEHDVFCQVNFCFLLSKLNKNTKKHIVFPAENTKNKWRGFATDSDVALRNNFSNARIISDDDLALSEQLWLAFSENNTVKMEELSFSKSIVFPYLKEICNAILQLWNGNFDAELQKIWQGNQNFEETFAKVQKNYGIYGFGDSQIKTRLK